ncbi:MAG: fumarate reductase/succinate dehydrogenase flavoprotein subunit, partial [Lentimicrobium sp.]|nr:fumarate reductase/succinate dehydrogenase flavoprotein subunit [Lentimicrobium sp.]
RLGASALMQGLADGYFVLPYTIQNYLSDQIRVPKFSADLPEFKQTEEAATDRLRKLMEVKGKQTVDSFHKRLGHIMWEYVGMGRNEAGLKKAIVEIAKLREEFWKDVKITGGMNEINPELEKAGRVADFLELGELMARDALIRNESCGGHFREEYQTPEGEALRDDQNLMYVSAWEFTGDNTEPRLNKEALDYEFVEVKQRNYK